MALNPADIAVVSRLLDEALALPGSEREAWLAALPADHQVHQDTLRDMLAQEAELDTDSRLAALPRLPPDESVAHEGDLVGPYRLIREIGHGGMGTVWLAERADGAYKRTVALKLPRLAWGAGLAERMAREREIGMLLEHPSIARLYDAGVDERGRPYLALEYIDGQPIDAWCDAQGLNVRDRLRLVVNVARAVAYAHGRLVVHRDLKPSNVLVTPDSQVHLLDFGIAKLLDEALLGDAGLTQQQGRVLTPHYASPEQVAGEPITVQSDVYSLGVLLYELLTGTLPIAPLRRTLGAVEEAILAGDAPLASSRVKERTMAKALRGEVDAILGKAMKLDPAERYPTADAFAQDIERYLRGDTVTAKPDSVGYRLRKAAARHKWGIGATTALLLVALSGGGAAAWQGYKAAREAERARAVTNLVTDLLRASSRPATPQGSTDGAVLDQGARLIETRFPGQPEVQAELYGVVSRVYADIGANKLAMDYAGRQLAALDRLPPDVPRRVSALLLLADSAITEGRIKDAEARVREAIVQAGSNLPLAAEGHALLARVAISQGKVSEARSSVALAEPQLLGLATPATTAAAWVLEAQAALLSRENRFDASVPLFDRAVQVAIQAEGESSSTASRVQALLARMLLDRERFPQAKQQFEAAVARVRSAGGTRNELQAALFTARFWSQAYYMGSVSYNETVQAWASIPMSLERPGADVPTFSRAEVDFLWARVMLHHGNLTEAEHLLSSSLPQVKRSTDRLGAHMIFSLVEGTLLMYLGEHEKAEPLLTEAIQLRIRAGQANSPYTAMNWASLALNALMRGDPERALVLLRDTPAFGFDNATGLSYDQPIKSLKAQALLEWGDAEAAVNEVPVQLQRVEVDALELPTSAFYGEALCAAHKPKEGMLALRLSIQDYSELTGSRHPMLARMRAVAGLCALALGNRQEAKQLSNLARLGIAAHPRLSPWFERPLLRLEGMLQQRPATVRGASTNHTRGSERRPGAS